MDVNIRVMLKIKKWEVNIGSGNELVPYDQINFAIWRH